MKRVIYIVFMIVFAFSLNVTAGDAVDKNENAKVFSNYINVQKALAADNFIDARTALESLAENSEGRLNELAVKASNSNDIKEIRSSFKLISAEMAKTEQPDGFGTAYCPMAKSWWVQKEGKINNPYFGKQMLTCGSFKDYKTEEKK